METRKSTTAGVLVWTPAPARNSTASSVISEDGEQGGKEDDFSSQMDENGIIGLSEALLNVELVGARPRCLTPEEPHPNGQTVGTPPEELSYSLSDHLSNTGFPGEDAQTLSSCKILDLFALDIICDVMC